MKSISVLKSASLFVVISVIATQQLFSQKRKVKGNKIIKKEIRNVDAFNRLHISAVGSVYLSQGDSENVTIETDSNLLGYIQTEVSNNQLNIKTNKKVNIKKMSKLEIHIQLKDINWLFVDAIGNVKCTTDLNLDKVDVHHSGVGNLELKGKVNELNLKNSGVGNVKAYDFRAKKINVENNGVGNVNIYASDELSLKNSGVGNIRYKGDAVIKDIKSSGVGNVSKVE